MMSMAVSYKEKHFKILPMYLQCMWLIKIYVSEARFNYRNKYCIQSKSEGDACRHIQHILSFSYFNIFQRNVKILFQRGDTPFHLAVAGGNLEITQMLLERTDVDFNHVNEVRDADPTRMFRFYFQYDSNNNHKMCRYNVVYNINTHVQNILKSATDKMQIHKPSVINVWCLLFSMQKVRIKLVYISALF